MNPPSVDPKLETPSGNGVGVAVGVGVGVAVGGIGVAVGVGVEVGVGVGVGVGPQYVQSPLTLQVLPHSTSVNKPELIVGYVPACRQCDLFVPGNKLGDDTVPLQFVIV